jgi:hypothetical protein
VARVSLFRGIRDADVAEVRVDVAISHSHILP